MTSTMTSTIDTFVEGEVSELSVSGAAALAAPGPGVWMSPWTLDSNTTDHLLVFNHTLGALPMSVKAFFTADQETISPILWSWSPTGSGNPVSISMTDKTISFAITASQPLHGVWNPIGGWTLYSSGYFMVIASTTP